MTTPVQGPVTGAPAAAAKPVIDPAGLKKVAKQFEAVFMRQMISSMRAGHLSDELFGSSAGDQFRDMSDAKLADNMADKGFGIGDMLLKQFMARPEVKPAAGGTTPSGGDAK